MLQHLSLSRSDSDLVYLFVSHPYSNISQFESLKMPWSMFVNFIRLVDRRILRLWNCWTFRRAGESAGSPKWRRFCVTVRSSQRPGCCMHAILIHICPSVCFIVCRYVTWSQLFPPGSSTVRGMATISFGAEKMGQKLVKMAHGRSRKQSGLEIEREERIQTPQEISNFRLFSLMYFCCCCLRNRCLRAQTGFANGCRHRRYVWNDEMSATCLTAL